MQGRKRERERVRRREADDNNASHGCETTERSRERRPSEFEGEEPRRLSLSRDVDAGGGTGGGDQGGGGGQRGGGQEQLDPALLQGRLHARLQEDDRSGLSRAAAAVSPRCRWISVCAYLLFVYGACGRSVVCCVCVNTYAVRATRGPAAVCKWCERVVSVCGCYPRYIASYKCTQG